MATSWDENGQVTFSLPEGSYRFRAEQYEMNFWSDTENHCTVSGCTEVYIHTLGTVNDQVKQSIAYGYDALNRLTVA
jgi:hypothetical protein